MPASSGVFFSSFFFLWLVSSSRAAGSRRVCDCFILSERGNGVVGRGEEIDLATRDLVNRHLPRSVDPNTRFNARLLPCFFSLFFSPKQPHFLPRYGATRLHAEISINLFISILGSLKSPHPRSIPDSPPRGPTLFLRSRLTDVSWKQIRKDIPFPLVCSGCRILCRNFYFEALFCWKQMQSRSCLQF